tara:strand:- start:9 stop:302 length:294 start_codon:yes stop_codon:yes gene_type:complete
MKNEKELKGQELVDFLMIRFNMTEDEALQNLAENIGNKKLEIGKDPIPFPFKFDVDNLEGLEPAYYVDDELVKIEKEIAQDLYDYWNDIVYIQPPIK